MQRRADIQVLFYCTQYKRKTLKKMDVLFERVAFMGFCID